MHHIYRMRRGRNLRGDFIPGKLIARMIDPSDPRRNWPPSITYGPGILRQIRHDRFEAVDPFGAVLYTDSFLAAVRHAFGRHLAALTPLSRQIATERRAEC